MLARSLIACLATLALVSAQATSSSGEGTIDGATTSTDALGYSCDPSKCQLPNCNCASTDAPGGIKPVLVPVLPQIVKADLPCLV